jgi:hypothetical protein
MEVSATSAPALAADPVNSRANQGKAIKTIAVAATLVMFDSSTKIYGASLRLGLWLVVNYKPRS